MGGKMKVLAIDMGSSGVRVMLADNNNCSMTELARFGHTAVEDDNSGFRWQIDKLIGDIIVTIDDAISKYDIKSIGICSWGVDYGVYNQKGELIDLPYCYRDNRNNIAYKKVHELISEKELFFKSGIYPNPINTLYQLYSDKMTDRYGENKVKILMIADMLAYKLTGNMKIEVSNASTTGLLNLNGNDWNYELINLLGLNNIEFPDLIYGGQNYGYYKNAVVKAVCSHDTASAIYAMGNLRKDTAFLSSGSWLLLGKVTDNPIISNKVFDIGFTNERIYDNKVSLLNNINGLFIIQRLVAESNITYVDIDKKMSSAKVLGELNVDELMSPVNMTGHITEMLGGKNYDIYDLVKTSYYALASKLAVALGNIDDVTGSITKKLVITGGATKARYLLEEIERQCKVDIECLSGEGAVLGNAEIQFDTFDN